MPSDTLGWVLCCCRTLKNTLRLMSVIKITPQIITQTKLPGNYHLDVHSNPFQSYRDFGWPLRVDNLTRGAGGVYLNLSPPPCAAIKSETDLSEHLISRALLNARNTYRLKADRSMHEHVVSITGETAQSSDESERTSHFLLTC